MSEASREERGSRSSGLDSVSGPWYVYLIVRYEVFERLAKLYASALLRPPLQGASADAVVYIGAQECEIDWYYSDDSRIVCFTPPSLLLSQLLITPGITDIQPVVVALTSLDATTNGLAACAIGGGCSFKYYGYETPTVSYINGGGSAGDVLRFVGYSGAAQPSDDMDIVIGPRNVNGGTSMRCDVSDVQFPGYSWESAWNCTAGDSVAGLYNLTSRTDADASSTWAGFGEAVFLRSATRLTPDAAATPHTYVAVPRVDTLSFNASGLLGGGTLTITGTGFDAVNPQANSVTAAGVPCAVTSVTRTSISCILGAGNVTAAPPVGPNGTVGFVPGGRGLERRLAMTPTNNNNYNEAYTALLDSPLDLATESQLVVGIAQNPQLFWYFQQLRGFFVPPVTANYSFFVQADDTARVYLSSNASATGERLVASQPSWCGDFLCYPQQISAPVALVGGLPYWFRVTHQQGPGASYVNVGLRIFSEGNPAVAAALQSPLQLARASVPDVLALRITEQHVRATWTVTVSGSDNGTVALLVGGVVALTVDVRTVRSWNDVAKLAGPLAAAWGVSQNQIGINFQQIIPKWPIVYAYVWTFSINWPLLYPIQWPALTAVDISLVRRSVNQTASVNVTAVKSASQPLQGYFQLSNGVTTAPQIFSLCAVGTWCQLTDLKAALTFLTGVVDIDLSNTAFSPSGDSFEIRAALWGAASIPGGIPNITVVVADAGGNPTLTGSASAIVVRTMTASSDPFYWPAPASLFRYPALSTVVTVTTNNILSTCGGVANGTLGCIFSYQSSLTPSLTSVSPASVSVGATLTLSGKGFIADPTQNFVSINGSTCIVATATATTLTCVVGNATAMGRYAPQVLVGAGRGLAQTTSIPPTVTVGLTISTAEPRRGSVAGGTQMLIVGSGFYTGSRLNNITVGGLPCVVTGATGQTISCITPAAVAPGTLPLIVDGTMLAGGFTYDAALTPLVTDLTPAVLSAAVSGYINITLTGTNLTKSAISVSFGPRACTSVIVSTLPTGNAVLVSCTLQRATGDTASLAAGSWKPMVRVDGQGLALVSPGLVLNSSYVVTSVTPSAGSIAGGTVVRITGAGFTGRPGALAPTFDFSWPTGEAFSIPCKVTWVAADGSAATCSTRALYNFELPAGPGGVGVSTVVNGSIVVRLNNVTAPCSSATCAFALSLAATPLVTNSSFPLTGGELLLSGANLLPPVDSGTPLTVTIGPWPCGFVNASISGDFLTCQLPAGQSGWWPLDVIVGDAGNASIAGSAVAVYLPLLVSSPLPPLPTGGIGGGMFMRLYGSGFGIDATAIVVNVTGASATVTATVLAVNFTTLDIMMPPVSLPPNSSWASVSLVVQLVNSVGGKATVVAGPVYNYTGFNYTNSKLTAVTPRSGVAGTVLRLTGSTFLGNGAAIPTVSIGGAPCSVTKANATSITCTVGNTPAGWHRVLVNVSGVGLAVVPPTTPSSAVNFTALQNVTAVSAALASLAGGNVVTINGFGFADPASPGASTTVSFCNAQCTVTSSSYSSLTCIAGSTLTPMLLNTTPGFAPSALLQGTLSGSSSTSYPLNNSVDGDVTSIFASCTVTWDMGAVTRAIVTGVSWYPKLRDLNPFINNGNSATWLGANNSGFVGATVLAAPGASTEGWNSYTINDATMGAVDLTALPTFRYLRWVAAQGYTDCQAAEVQFVGFAVSAAQDAAYCPPVITTTAAVSAPFTAPVIGMTTTNASVALVYNLNATPFISSIVPNNGTALGGTTITLSGYGFVTGLTVKLNGMPCSVTAVSNVTITCVTSARTSVEPVSVQVALASGGVALYDAAVTYFRYLDRWSALTTWQFNEPPVEGDAVIVPLGQAVLVDIDPPQLAILVVEGDLVFDRRDGAFDAKFIFVFGGHLEIGTEAEPFLNNLVITLHGSRAGDAELPDIGAKGLIVMDYFSNMIGTAQKGMQSAVSGFIDWAKEYKANYRQGTLDIHGRPRLRVWTKLGATAVAGSRAFTTAEACDFAPGDIIVLTSTTDNPKQAEELTIAAAVSAHSFTTRTPLKYTHTVAILSAGDYNFGRDVDISGEVGLLSRNVVVQGDSNSPNELYGVHTGAFHGGTMRVENAEYRLCGQSFFLGRYCTHFHMAGTESQSYVRFNSIHHSFQRAVTTHATESANIIGNFAYSVVRCFW